jgi:hypothetical protein
MLGRVRRPVVTATAVVVMAVLSGCTSVGTADPAPSTPSSAPSSAPPGATAGETAGALSNTTSTTTTEVPSSTTGQTGTDGPASPTSSPASTTSPPDPPTSTPPCTAELGDGCGAYDYPGIPNSNGSNTYVSNQAVGPQHGTTQTIHVRHPGDWTLVANAVPHGYRGVQTFPDVQQLFNNWCGNGWGDCPNGTGTPLDSLSTLKVTYEETSPPDRKSINEFAVDVWSDNYGSDIMFWTDTHGRCDEGAFGSTVLGHAVIDGQGWTVHRYGGPGDEVIFVLDGAGGKGTCAQQRSGTVNVKAGLDWLTANGFATGPQTITQVNTGWEITSADDATFAMHAYSIEARPR